MFQQGSFDPIEVQAPIGGMNRFVAPEVLPSNLCYTLENAIPLPVGSCQVRYGTKQIEELTRIFDGIDEDAYTIELFRHQLPDNGFCDLYYLAVPKIDESAEQFNVETTNRFSFVSNDFDVYEKSSKIKVNYNFNGIPFTLIGIISESIPNIAEQSVQISISGSYFPDAGVEIVSVYRFSGQIGYSRVDDFYDQSAIRVTNLSSACVPRFSFFQNKILICNGVDNVFFVNFLDLNPGFDIEVRRVFGMVKEVYVNTPNRIDEKNISFNFIPGFQQNKYSPGQIVSIEINGAEETYIVEDAQVNANLITFTFTEGSPGIPEIQQGDEVYLYYKDYPPAFSYIYPAKDRIWALGPGIANTSYREPDQALRVYYSYGVNTIQKIFNENTKTVPSIDISDKHKTEDNLEAICQVNGLMVFVGRKHSQAWQGYTPGDGGDFRWLTTINEGIFNGNLLIESPNDTYFISPTGLKSFSTLNIGNQFSASSITALDPVMISYMKETENNDFTYMQCRSFLYKKGSFAGFKIGNNNILASLYNTSPYAWFMLSGDFYRASSFCESKSGLLMSIGNKIYQYADGADGKEKIYGDNNGEEIIKFSWTTGLLKARGSDTKRYCNKHYEIIVSYSSSFQANQRNEFNISITSESPRIYTISDKCKFTESGDSLGRPLVGVGAGFRLSDEKTYSVNKRFKFTSSSFYCTISGYTVSGPVNIKRLKLFGIGERSG